MICSVMLLALALAVIDIGVHCPPFFDQITGTITINTFFIKKKFSTV